MGSPLFQQYADLGEAEALAFHLRAYSLPTPQMVLSAIPVTLPFLMNILALSRPLILATSVNAGPILARGRGHYP